MRKNIKYSLMLKIINENIKEDVIKNVKEENDANDENV